MSWSSQDKKVNEHRLSTIYFLKNNFDKNRRALNLKKQRTWNSFQSVKKKYFPNLPSRRKGDSISVSLLGLNFCLKKKQNS